MRPAAIWDASKRSRPDWPGSTENSKIKAQAASRTMTQGDRKLASWRSFGCPNGSREGRFVCDRGAVLSVGPSSDPPDTIRESEILVHVTCRTQKITGTSKLGFDHLAQETLGSERSDACVARVDATLSMVKIIFR